MAADPSESIEKKRAEAGGVAESTEPGVEGEIDELDETTETPFDHPLFLPAICAGLCVWFGYDGFLNQDPDMLEHVGFNRGGFAVLSVLTGWFGYKGWKEMRERREQQDDADGER